MKPYYADDQVTLFHGDCLKITEWLASDVLCTDPPYGIGWQQSSCTVASRRAHGGIANDTDTAIRDAALTAWGNVKPGIIFGSFRSEAPANVLQTLVWKKPTDAGVVGSTTGYRTDVELIYLTGRHERRNAQRSSVLESRCVMRTHREAEGEHPHEKHVAILEQLIEWTSGVIADPFAGSGSTLVAARNLGRRAIGVELEERYCEIAARRLDQMCLDFGGAE